MSLPIFQTVVEESTCYLTDMSRTRQKEEQETSARRRRAQGLGAMWERFIILEDNKASLAHYLSTEILESYSTPPGWELAINGGFKDTLKVWSSDTSRHDIRELTSDHEEADTRIILHARDATAKRCKQVNILCHDTDVLVLLLVHREQLCQEIWMFPGTSRQRRYIPVHSIPLSEEKRKSLLALHAITGCDTTSQFYGVGKASAWKVFEDAPDLLEHLEEDSQISADVLAKAEAFVCKLYNPLLDFQLQPTGARRNWRNVLNRQRFEATLQQHRNPSENDDLGLEVSHALRRAIKCQIASDDTLTPHSTVHFSMQSNTFTHAFQSTTFTVRNFREGSARLDTYLQALAAKLNSNEEFAPDESFTMETTFIHTPGPRSGNGKQYKPSDAACHAWLKLYLQLLQHQVLYFDMDSVIYSHKPGQPDITPGNYLGEMTDELEGDHIVEFTSAGPKNYGYITNAEKKCCKVRGFTLNVRGSQYLNYEVMRQNLLKEITDPKDERRAVGVPNLTFLHDPQKKDIYNSSRTKRYGLVFDKRVVDHVTFLFLRVHSFHARWYGYGQRRNPLRIVENGRADPVCKISFFPIKKMRFFTSGFSYLGLNVRGLSTNPLPVFLPCNQVFLKKIGFTDAILFGHVTQILQSDWSRASFA